ncbi:MAG: CHAT domain-containing protein, partial [Acidobacteria bacterium]|nr:CHAT domain-containing protein [Acidobacteriota bacterium]
VDDRSTALFMTSVYRSIRDGVGRSRALLQARRELFGREAEARLVFRTRPISYAHPRFWAPFILAGTP